MTKSSFTFGSNNPVSKLVAINYSAVRQQFLNYSWHVPVVLRKWGAEFVVVSFDTPVAPIFDVFDLNLMQSTWCDYDLNRFQSHLHRIYNGSTNDWTQEN